jgi:hypothetical protein
MRKKVILVLIMMTAVLAGAGTGQQGKPNVLPKTQSIFQPLMPTVTATLKVASPVLTLDGHCWGYCPLTIHFSGTIQVNWACTVKYRFIRSDGTAESTITLACGGAGSYPVSDTWSIGINHYSGWKAIEVLSPVSIKSNKATFMVECLPPPTIEEAYIFGDRLDIYGYNFCTAQGLGTKDFSLDGKLLSTLPGYSLMNWRHNPPAYDMAEFKYPDDIIPWEHTYQFGVTDGGKIVSQVYAWKFYYYIRGPQGCPVGCPFDFDVVQLPATQDGLTVNLLSISSPNDSYTAYACGQLMGGSWDHPLTVISWTRTSNDGTVRALIPPNVSPGSYVLVLEKNGIMVSCEAPSFEVTASK